MKPTRLFETSLYCDDPRRCAEFYRRLMSLDVLTEIERLIALDAGGGTVLLLFKRGATVEAIDSPLGRIPAHDGSGPTHLAFMIPAAELGAWEKRLAEHGVEIESRISWPRGGTSLYFRDPEGHSVEIATPGVWRNGM